MPLNYTQHWLYHQWPIDLTEGRGWLSYTLLCGNALLTNTYTNTTDINKYFSRVICVYPG